MSWWQHRTPGNSICCCSVALKPTIVQCVKSMAFNHIRNESPAEKENIFKCFCAVQCYSLTSLTTNPPCNTTGSSETIPIVKWNGDNNNNGYVAIFDYKTETWHSSIIMYKIWVKMQTHRKIWEAKTQLNPDKIFKFFW